MFCPSCVCVWLPFEYALSSPSLGGPERHIEEGRQVHPLCLQSLEGFLLVVTSHGDMIYVTENISRFMGLSQVKTN